MDGHLSDRLRKQLDELDPQQLARLGAYIAALAPERRAYLDRLAAHLAERFGRDPSTLPRSGAVYPNSHQDANGRYDGFELTVQDRPDLSGFVTFLEWVYLTRKAAAAAIEGARVHVGPAFNTAHEIRAMRDATTGQSAPSDG